MSEAPNFWSSRAAESSDSFATRTGRDLWAGESNEAIFVRLDAHIYIAASMLGLTDDNEKRAAEAKRDALLSKMKTIAGLHRTIDDAEFRDKVIALAQEAGLKPTLTVSHCARRGKLARRAVAIFMLRP